MQKTLLGILMGAMIGLLPVIGAAEVYQWTDKDGNIHFGDKPGGENSKKLKYKSQSKQVNSPKTKTTEELANELRESRLKREEIRKKTNDRANAAQCQRRQQEITKLRQEVSRIAKTYSRFAHSDYRKAKDMKKRIAKLEKQYNRLCR